jgi:F0F1-type ATP synthase epsilon subunit
VFADFENQKEESLMHLFLKRTAFAGAVGALALLGGCASVDDVKHAQATADQALSAANQAQQTASAAGSSAQSAMSAAQAAQQSADKANASVAELSGQVQTLQQQKIARRGERD